MIQRIAHHLRVHLQPEPELKEQLWSFLRDRELLLVLDNTEQNPDAPRVIGELLAAAPRVKCLVSTRRALEVRVERLLEVPPMPAEEAEALFVQSRPQPPGRLRRHRRQRGRRGGAVPAPGYVPLALELAASRVVGMTPRDMLGRLDERFRLLQTRAPDLPPRQRALRGAIDWSYDLLSEEDRSLFVQLSVFAGGFTLAAAEAVGDTLDSFEGVMELRRHSLLRAETQAATQQTRFVMLESVREYAAEKQSDPQVPRRHAAYFLRFAEERAARMRSSEEPAALDELAADFENIRAAIAWAGAAPDNEACARLTLAFHAVLYRRGFWTAAREQLELGLAAVGKLNSGGAQPPGGDPPSPGGAGARSRRPGRGGRHRRCQCGDPARAGGCAWSGGRNEPAGPHRDGQGRPRRCPAAPHGSGRRPGRGGPRAPGMLIHNLARLADRRGAPDVAWTLYEQALEQRRAAGDARGEAETLTNLGAAAHTRGDRDRARELYAAALAASRALRDRHAVAVLLNNLGELAEAEGRVAEAAACFVHARRMFEDLQSAFAPVAAQGLERLAALCAPEAWRELEARAERARWEELPACGRPALRSPE